MSSPATAKNVLAVGATVSGNTRFNVEGIIYPGNDEPDIDTVTFFSSFGPTSDGRIKPEVVAPGDMVRCAPPSWDELNCICSRGQSEPFVFFVERENMQVARVSFIFSTW